MTGRSRTRVLADLVEQGLITREQDEGDRRQSVLALTPRGRRVPAGSADPERSADQERGAAAERGPEREQAGLGEEDDQQPD